MKQLEETMMKKTISTILLFASIYAGAQTINETATMNRINQINYKEIKLNLKSTNLTFFQPKQYSLINSNKGQTYNLNIDIEKEQPIPRRNTDAVYQKTEFENYSNPYKQPVGDLLIGKF